MKRVVVTGMAGISSLGDSWESISGKLHGNVSAIRRMDDWDRYEELKTRLGGPILDFKAPAHYTRKVTRTMGRVALLATTATEAALKDAAQVDKMVKGLRAKAFSGDAWDALLQLGLKVAHT